MEKTLENAILNAGIGHIVSENNQGIMHKDPNVVFGHCAISLWLQDYGRAYLKVLQGKKLKTAEREEMEASENAFVTGYADRLFTSDMGTATQAFYKLKHMLEEKYGKKYAAPDKGGLKYYV